MLADVRTGDLGGNRLELAADVLGRVWLGVPEVDVARPTLKEDHHDGLCATESARAIVLRCRLRRFLREKVGEVEAEESDRSRAQEFAACGTFACMTTASGYDQHDSSRHHSRTVAVLYQLYKNPLL